MRGLAKNIGPTIAGSLRTITNRRGGVVRRGTYVVCARRGRTSAKRGNSGVSVQSLSRYTTEARMCTRCEPPISHHSVSGNGIYFAGPMPVNVREIQHVGLSR
jgi:hypothetical protein